MEPLIRQFSSEDLLRLAGHIPPETLAHHHERLAWQEEKCALYLVAWRGDVVAGRATLLWESKYPQVVQRHPMGCEVNALEATPTGQGVGRALMQAAEDAVRARGSLSLGVAVALTNDDARRLYDRLGYRDWGGGPVCDEWDEYDEGRVLVRHHADACNYLIKDI